MNEQPVEEKEPAFVKLLSKTAPSKLDDPYVKKVLLGLLLCFLPYFIITQVIIFWDAPLSLGVILVKGIQLLAVIIYLLFLSSYFYKFYMKKSKSDH